MAWCFRCQQNVLVSTRKWSSADGKYIYIQQTCTRCNMVLSTNRQRAVRSGLDPGNMRLIGGHALTNGG